MQGRGALVRCCYDASRKDNNEALRPPSIALLAEDERREFRCCCSRDWDSLRRAVGFASELLLTVCPFLSILSRPTSEPPSNVCVEWNENKHRGSTSWWWMNAAGRKITAIVGGGCELYIWLIDLYFVEVILKFFERLGKKRFFD